MSYGGRSFASTDYAGPDTQQARGTGRSRGFAGVAFAGPATRFAPAGGTPLADDGDGGALLTLLALPPVTVTVFA